MAIKSFKRSEKKYLLNKEQYDKLMERVMDYMDYDAHCKEGQNYSIYNVYYDTDNNDVIRHSISKPYYKEKFRLRSYNVPKSEDDIVFLELKKKINSVVSKRRAVMTLGEAKKFLSTGERPDLDDYVSNQVLNEIEYYLKNNEVKPKVYVSYSRMALFAKDNKEFRLTFDSKIITRRKDLYLESGEYGNELLKNQQYLMEVKILGAMPIWFASILSELKIYNTHFSKYGNEYMRYTLNKHVSQNNNKTNTYEMYERKEKIC